MHTSEFWSPWIIFSLTKLCFPALSMMLKIAPLEIFFFNLGVALEIFFRRFSCKMQRARGRTNPNVGTVYPHSDHNGKHPRVRSQRNASLWDRGHQKRKGRDWVQRNKEHILFSCPFLFYLIYHFSEEGICLAALLWNQHLWLETFNIASSDIQMDSSSMGNTS